MLTRRHNAVAGDAQCSNTRSSWREACEVSASGSERCSAAQMLDSRAGRCSQPAAARWTSCAPQQVAAPATRPLPAAPARAHMTRGAEKRRVIEGHKSSFSTILRPKTHATLPCTPHAARTLTRHGGRRGAHSVRVPGGNQPGKLTWRRGAAARRKEGCRNAEMGIW
jgi:hypothetical protein